MSEVLRKLRCAIYTRKSTEEGLDQNYNSLDAQRDACLAYIASQKSEGWVALRDSYDDGGFTGGNLTVSPTGLKIDMNPDYPLDFSRSHRNDRRMTGITPQAHEPGPSRVGN